MPQDGITPAEHKDIMAAQDALGATATALVNISNLANELLCYFVGRKHAHVVIPCEQNEHHDAHFWRTSTHSKLTTSGSPCNSDILESF
jgi:hypothetical protein